MTKRCIICLVRVDTVNKDGECQECVEELALIEAIEMEEQREADKHGIDTDTTG